MKTYVNKSLITWVIVLVINAVAFAFCLLQGFYICVRITSVGLFMVTSQMLHLLHRNAEEFEKLVQSIRYAEFQTSYHTPEGEKIPIPEDLKEQIDGALIQYKNRLQKKESALLYFQALANHLDTAILVYDLSGRVEWCNRSMHYLLKRENLTDIDDLASLCEDLPNKLKQLRIGEVSVVRLNHKPEVVQLAFSGVEFVIEGRLLMVCSFKNIRTVLENKEIEAWEKLLRVITHEVMNSIAPIISLSDLLAKQIKLGSDEITAEELHQAVNTIHNRSKGILQFVETYRQITHLPVPKLTPVPVREIVSNVIRLMNHLNISVNPVLSQSPLIILADSSQIEQVLINLIKNAQEAARPDVPIHIVVNAGSYDENTVFLSVSDNGRGILEDVQEHIFVPFFTTKPSGSGIGLSISHQIMFRHRGCILVDSQEDVGSTFTLLFSKI